MLRPLRILPFLLIAAIGCGDDVAPMPTDGGADADADATVDADPTCDMDFVVEPGEATAHPEPFGSAAGEVRAGVLTADAMPDDPSNLLNWQAGDLVLANDRIALVIASRLETDGYNPWGGEVSGLARVEGGLMVAPADYNEAIPGIGRSSVLASSVTILSDGSDGAAIVRVIGFLRSIPFSDFARALAPGEWDDVEVAVDYVLEPGADVVDVRYTFNNERASQMRFPPFLLIFQNDRMPGFAKDVGFGVSNGDVVEWIGYVDDQNTSYAVESAYGEVTLFIEVSGTMVFQGSGAPNIIPACTQVTEDVIRYHVGGPGIDGLKAAIARTQGTAQRTISGTVTEDGGGPAEGVRVHAELSDGSAYLTRSAVTDATGAYELNVPADASARLTAWRRGDAVVGPEAAFVGMDSVDLAMGPRGMVHVVVDDVAGDPMPSRIQIIPEGELPSVPSAFGEAGVPHGRMHIAFPINGDVTLPVPPGDHRVVVSRGFEYELGHDAVVTVTAGATTEVAATLDRVVDTTGVMCADFHIHTNRSPDSPDPGRFKLASALGDGVEIPCRSDHDWVWEFETELADMAMTDFAFGVTALELTSFTWGHFGVFPATRNLDPTVWNDGAVSWTGRQPPEVFEEVRAMTSEPAMIMNHPRATAAGGYLSAVGYDPDTGTVRNPELWVDGFTLIETFNETSFDEGLESDVADWFSFLNHGERMFAVGSSDSHGVMQGAPVGYPRTCLELGMDEPAALRAGGAEDLVRDTATSGAFTVSGGIYLTVEARGGVGPGGEVTGAGASEDLAVVVQAPSWVDVDVLEVWVDGVMVGDVDLSAATDVVRYDDTLGVDIDPSGSWVILHAKGDIALDPVHPGRQPFAVSQPIFFVP